MPQSPGDLERPSIIASEIYIACYTEKSGQGLGCLEEFASGDAIGFWVNWDIRERFLERVHECSTRRKSWRRHLECSCKRKEVERNSCFMSMLEYSFLTDKIQSLLVRGRLGDLVSWRSVGLTTEYVIRGFQDDLQTFCKPRDGSTTRSERPVDGGC